MKKNDFLITDKYSLADAELEISNGNLVHASEILNKLLDIDESNTLVLNDIAVVQILNQEYDAAMSNLKKICTIEPDNEVALGNIEYINSNNLLQNQSKVIFENIDTPSDEISKIKLEYERLQSNWNTFGKNDPMWAILTDPAKKDNKWQPGEFFETGINDIERVISYTKQLNLNLNYNKAIDFGCGTGRSTRFLKKLDFMVIGIDISREMIEMARNLDLSGDYQLVSNGEYSHLGVNKFDLIQSIFTFDNIPGWDNRTKILVGLRNLMNPTGRMICLDATPELYTNESASFSTKDFPENWVAKTGDIVRDIMRDVDDKRPVEDIFWTIQDYHKLFDLAGLEIEATYKPLGYDYEPFAWISEKEIAPWMIFVLKKR